MTNIPGDIDKGVQEGSGTNPLPVDIPLTFSRDQGVLLMESDAGRMRVAIHAGTDPSVLLNLQQYLATPLDVDLVTAREFERLVAEHYALNEGDTFFASHADNSEVLSTTKLIRSLISEACRTDASDVHFEPTKAGLTIRWRTNGMLMEKLRMPPEITDCVLENLKSMAGLTNITAQTPQDGQISLKLNGNLIDLRVSVFPNATNERYVVHISDDNHSEISLDLPGMSADVHDVLAEALTEPEGIILIAGPAQSGKTTTLYAAMEQLQDGRRNILTIENPVKQQMDGIGQMQVNQAQGLTYAAGLEALMKQDPDIIMVGELGDAKTTQSAVQAALDGSLVLSTVQSENSVRAITRMLELKIDPFKLASTLHAVIAQRMVKKLCEHCRKPVQADGSMASLLGFDRGTVVFEACGCDKCDHTGYQGHVGVFEAIRIDDTIRKLISEGGDESRIAGQAFLKNKSLAAAARAFVREGIIPVEEGIRISRGRC